MQNKLKPLTENKVTAEIPTEAAAFRGWAIGAHKLVLKNIRELADRQDVLLAEIDELNKIDRESRGRLAFNRVDMLEGNVAQLSYLTDEIRGLLAI